MNKPRNTSIEPAAMREYWRNRYYDRKAAYALQGLNSKGSPRLRRENLDPSKRLYHYRCVGLAKYRARAARNVAMGLTTRGTQRRAYRPGRPVNPVAIAWLQFRAEKEL